MKVTESPSQMCQISVTCEYGDRFVSNHGGHQVPVIRHVTSN